ncbi:MAG: hypothetical protein AAF724_17980 [Pseudomonadota bacterium]
MADQLPETHEPYSEAESAVLRFSLEISAIARASDKIEVLPLLRRIRGYLNKE